MDYPIVEIDHKHNGERLLRMLQSQHPEYHPLMSIARIAHQAEAGITRTNSEGETITEPDYRLALQAHQTVLRYVEPELKSVEVKVEKKDTRTINVRLFEEVKDVVTVEGSSSREALHDAPRELLENMVDSIIANEVKEAMES